MANPPDLADKIATALEDRFDIGEFDLPFLDEPRDFDWAEHTDVVEVIRKVLTEEGIKL